MKLAAVAEISPTFVSHKTKSPEMSLFSMANAPTFPTIENAIIPDINADNIFFVNSIVISPLSECEEKTSFM